ncbi:DUF2442 domain-containing protein [Methylotuvimicrobium sp. KM2]|uniref:DUF2442 domain-containing protein n=1 Tax=Methylotuvimicrobium sp. KM2 TaxID=3133976 RepID=UPI003100E64F
MMKLVNFTHLHDYWFVLDFENGEQKRVDLSNLIASHVNQEEIKTAHIDSEWGCLEFNNAMVDIEPKTLYSYAKQNEAEAA